MSSRRQAMVAVVLAGGLLVGGCGSDDGSQGAAVSSTAEVPDTAAAPSTTGDDASEAEPTGGDACDIVSDEVAADVLGVEIVRREPSGEVGGPSVGCIKGSERSEDPADFSYVSVSVTADGATLVGGAEAEAESVAVDGLGEQAVYLPSAGTLFIADGTDAIQVQVVQGGVPGSQEDAVTVAADVLDRRG